MSPETGNTVAGELPAKNIRAKATEAYAVGSRESLEEQRVLDYLPLVRHIVEAHDGIVTVESETGKGSTFTIRLPIEGPAGEQQ